MRTCSVCTLLVLTFFSFGVAQGVKVSDSLEDLETAAGVDPYDAAAHYNLALGYWSKKRLADAEEALRRAIELDAQFAPACLALAYLPLAQRPELREEIFEGEVPEEWDERLQESGRLYRRAFLVDPLTDLRIMAAVTPGRSAVFSMSAAAAYYDAYFRVFDDFQSGDFEAAYLKFDRLIQGLKGRGRTPSSLIWYRGLSAAHVGEYEKAVEDIESLVERQEELEDSDELVRVPLRTNEYRYLLAFIEEKRGNTERAVQLYREALVSDVGLYMAHVRLAEIHEAAGEWDESLAERQRAVNANPDDPTLLTELGVTQARMELWNEALDTMRQSVEANPDDPRPWYFLAMLAQKSGDLAGATEGYEAFLKRAPSRFGAQIDDARARLRAIR